MAIPVSLYKGKVASTSGASTYTSSPTWTPGANSLLLAFVVGSLASSPTDPTGVTGHGQTYTKLVGYTLSTTHAMSVWYASAGASPTSVAEVATFASSRTGGGIIAFEVTGIDATGGILNALVAYNTGTDSTGTTGTTTFAARSHANNAQITFWLHLGNNEVTNPMTDWTETSGADGSYASPSTSIEVEFRQDGTWTTSCTATWTTSGYWRGIGIELKGILTAGAPTIASASALYAPSLTVGAVTLALATLASAAGLYAPTVAFAPQSLVLPTISTGHTISAPTVSPGAVTILAPSILGAGGSDSFTDADDTALATHDANWGDCGSTYVVANCEIIGNAARGTNAWVTFGGRYTTSSADSSQILESANADPNAFVFVCVRASASSLGYYLRFGGPSGGNWTTVNFWKEGTGYIAVGSSGGPWSQATAHTLRLTASGTSTVRLTAYVDDVDCGYYDDASSPLGSGNPGFAGYANGNHANATFDDWTDGTSGGASLYAPSVGQSAASQSITTATIGAGSSLTEPTISAGAVSLTLPTIASTSALSAPTVAPGQVTLTLPTLGTTAALSTPTVSAGVMTLVGETVATTAALYAPTVAPGSVTCVLPTLSTSATLYAPTVALGATTITLPTLASGTSISAPTVAPGATTLTLPTVASSAALYAPTVVRAVLVVELREGATVRATWTIGLTSAFATSQLDLTTGERDAITDWDALRVVPIANGVQARASWVVVPTPACVPLALPTLASGAALYGPTVAHGASNIALPTIASVAALFSPTITPGPVTITLPTVASGETVFAPTVAPGAATIVAPTISTAVALLAPSLTVGPVSVSVPTMASAATLGVPAITTGAVVGLPTVSSGVSLFAPTVAPGPVVLAVPTIDSGVILTAPSLGTTLVLPTIAGSSTLTSPTVTSNAATVGCPTIASQATLHAPAIRHAFTPTSMPPFAVWGVLLMT